MDYQISPIPDNKAERIAALRSAMCAYVPREDRFDRITRMAQRQLHVPVELISIIEDGATVKAMLIAQFIRQRLPANAILCCMPGGRGCIFFAARDKSVLREQIASFLQEQDAAPVARMVFPQQMHLISSSLQLEGDEAKLDAELLLEKVMGQLAERNAVSSILR